LPNTVGTGCNFVDNAVDLDPGFMGINSGLGLPNMVESYMGGTQFCGTITGVDPATNVEMMSNVFPNPSGSDFIFSAKENHIAITVTDVSGKILDTHTQVMAGASFRFGQHYPAGMYLVRALDENGNTTTLKVLKTR